MARESAICYDSQVEECMHSENSHLLSCHFIFYSATMSSRPAHIIFKDLPFSEGQTQIFILPYAVAHVILLMNFIALLILMLFNESVLLKKNLQYARFNFHLY